MRSHGTRYLSFCISLVLSHFHAKKEQGTKCALLCIFNGFQFSKRISLPQIGYALL